MRPHELRGQAILRRTPKPEARVAEVGVLIGKLSRFLLSKRPGLHLTMVDSWAPEADQPERYKATGDTHATHDAARAKQHRKEALERIFDFRDRVTIRDMTSVRAAALTDDESLDLVFLDADHSYEGVQEDIRAWFPKVKRGGWIGGHDYNNQDPAFKFGVDDAVDEFAGQMGKTVQIDDHFTWFVRRD